MNDKPMSEDEKRGFANSAKSTLRYLEDLQGRCKQSALDCQKSADDENETALQRAYNQGRADALTTMSEYVDAGIKEITDLLGNYELIKRTDDKPPQ